MKKVVPPYDKKNSSMPKKFTDGNKFSYENFSIGRPHFHATATSKLKLKIFSYKR